MATPGARRPPNPLRSVFNGFAGSIVVVGGAVATIAAASTAVSSALVLRSRARRATCGCTRAASTRADFCAKLGQPEDAAVEQMRLLLENFSPALGRATALLDERGLK